MDAKTIDQIAQILTVLRNSCKEGEDGTWDCSTDEGKEGFSYMADYCEKIAELIGVELEPYPNEEDERGI